MIFCIIERTYLSLNDSIKILWLKPTTESWNKNIIIDILIIIWKIIRKMVSEKLFILFSQLMTNRTRIIINWWKLATYFLKNFFYFFLTTFLRCFNQKFFFIWFFIFNKFFFMIMIKVIEQIKIKSKRWS